MILKPHGTVRFNPRQSRWLGYKYWKHVLTRADGQEGPAAKCNSHWSLHRDKSQSRSSLSALSAGDENVRSRTCKDLIRWPARDQCRFVHVRSQDRSLICNWMGLESRGWILIVCKPRCSRPRGWWWWAWMRREWCLVSWPAAPTLMRTTGLAPAPDGRWVWSPKQQPLPRCNLFTWWSAHTVHHLPHLISTLYLNSNSQWTYNYLSWILYQIWSSIWNTQYLVRFRHASGIDSESESCTNSEIHLSCWLLFQVWRWVGIEAWG